MEILTEQQIKDVANWLQGDPRLTEMGIPEDFKASYTKRLKEKNIIKEAMEAIEGFEKENPGQKKGLTPFEFEKINKVE